MQKIKQKIRTIIASTLICVMLFSPVHIASAGIWAENFAANVMKELLENITQIIWEALGSAAKMVAIRQATNMLDSMLYDGEVERNISNFHDFLVTKPLEDAVTYGESFLTSALNGAGSSDFSGGGALGDALKDAGKGVINSHKSSASFPTVTYGDSCSGGDDIFADGFDCYEAIVTDAINMPIGMAIAVNAAVATKYSNEKMTRDLRATASGVLPTVDEDGNVTLPATFNEELQLQQVKMPLEALASGDSNAFSSVIKSFVTTMIVRIVTEGVMDNN